MRLRFAATIGAALLASCGAKDQAASNSAGARLERAAEAQGLVLSPDAPLTGSWAHETDRLCIVDAADDQRRIGVAVDYGPGQTCVARGLVAASAGERVRIALGDCRFDAAFDGERLTFPAEVPAACDALCSGRASIAALSVERLSEAASEARMVRAPDGKPLCP